jgi:acylphosphatase
MMAVHEVAAFVAVNDGEVEVGMAKIDEELCEKFQRWMRKPQQRQKCQKEDGKDHRVGGRATMAPPNEAVPKILVRNSAGNRNCETNISRKRHKVTTMFG